MAGITHSGYDRSKLSEGMRVVLTCEPYNNHDPNAIRIEDREGNRIAYVPAPVAKVLSPMLQLKKFPYKAFVAIVNDGEYNIWGVRLDLYRYPEDKP